ncbi:MAG: hypothetical protein ACI9TB_001250 [Parasphingorhabdus sp.]|jgi:hypothetical protein
MLEKRSRKWQTVERLANWWSKSLIDCSSALATVAGDAYFHNNIVQGKFMTDFKDRENAFEAKFARDEEMQFRVTARRNRLLGQWAAEKMGLTAEETDAYAKEVVAADFEEAGDEDVIRKLLGDLTSAGVDMDDAGIRTALAEKMVEARRQFIEEAK